METKYWIKKGMTVLHNDIKGDVVVERVVYKDVIMSDGTTKKYTIGVKCHWVVDGEYRTGVFHTKELRPKDDNKSTT